MIVLRRLAHGVWDHAGGRFTEWLGVIPLLGIGAALHLQADTLWTTPSFAKLALWATAAIWTIIILTVANLRLFALLINGTFRQFQHSPTIRFAASCVASLFWMLFTMGILSAWWDAGGSPTGIVAYGTLLCLELRNAYVSRVDMAATREVRNAGTDR